MKKKILTMKNDIVYDKKKNITPIKKTGINHQTTNRKRGLPLNHTHKK